jgi:hypothetical protein
MTPLTRAIAVGLTTFAACVVGMLLQDLVAPDVLTASKGAVGAMIGLVSLLLALVLGLLVYTAFSVFTAQQSEAYSLGPVIADIDLALEQYGPEGADGRAGLRASLERTRMRFFGDAEHGPRPYSFEEMKTVFAGLDGYFESLEPATDRQRRLLNKAWDLARKYHDTQMLMTRQLASPFPPHVQTIVICWAAILFLGNGLVATPNAVTVIADLAGAISIATAMFLILELSHPYTGLIRISPAGVDNALRVLGKVSGPVSDEIGRAQDVRTAA